MKLDRGNPNLMKKAATRVNSPAPLEAFANTLGDVAAKRRHRATVGYVPLPKDPNAALPPTISVWAQPVYVPPKSEYVRPGAEDFLRCKSRGL
jgi:hypothetical protein